MLINLRSGQIDADLPEAMAFAVDIAEHVQSVTDTQVGVWQSLYGQPLGTVSWSVMAESFADLATLNQKLAEDAGYLEKSSAARSMFIAGSFEDRITRIVHTAGTAGHMAFSGGTTAVAAGGRQAEAVAFGTEMADLVSAATGNSVVFCIDGYSELGRMTWIQGLPDAEAVDASQAALAEDPAIAAKMGEGGELFLPGSATGFLSQRIN